MTYPALIFDLDDTLLDTYGQLVMEAHYQACIAMFQAGLQIPVPELFETRKSLLLKHPPEQINHLLASHFGCHEPQIIQAGFERYFNPEITDLEPLPGVRELLQRLAANYWLFLVTSGYEKTQRRKVEVLEIADFFETIYYVDIQDPQGKEKAFQTIQTQHQLQAENILVIGDRITNEIAAGNRLGFHTLWIQRGECARIEPQHFGETPNYTLEDINQMENILDLWQPVPAGPR